jgi:hypothetical protein
VRGRVLRASENGPLRTTIQGHNEG